MDEPTVRPETEKDHRAAENVPLAFAAGNGL